MTENSLGTSANIAEIAESTNEKGTKDSDSTPLNRKDGEDDISTAELLVSVKTGVITYISLGTVILIFILTFIGVIINQKKKGGQENEEQIN